MKNLATYLTFDGNCREAMSFYRDCLGAELNMKPFSEAPFDVPADAKDRVLHARLEKGSWLLLASDTLPGMQFQRGDNFSIWVDCEDQHELESFFTALARNGKITMPLDDAFWGARFGMLRDQFGIHWMLALQQPSKTD